MNNFTSFILFPFKMYNFSSRLVSLVHVTVVSFDEKVVSNVLRNLRGNEGHVYIFLLEKSSKVIKSLMSMKVNDF